ncbi:MAG: DUF502 domain-containing protein [Paracoccaceae bacterium]|jgi:uncharacterized membrane protein|nr:DUF502 domain-containing protein [Paracoccaceae bacterium]MDP5344627.1 DUF502 domain-containing protein [Paracoccaceae bacterium]
MTDPAQNEPRRKGFFATMRSSFLTGLVVVLPIGLTIYLIWSVIGWIDSWVLPFVPASYQPDALFKFYFGPDTVLNVRGVGVVVFLVFTMLVGWLAKGLIGRSMLVYSEKLVDRMPVVRSIYNGLKQIAETVFAQSETNFEKACLIEYPRPGIWAIGFVSTKAKGEIAQKFSHDVQMLSVFVPTTPNPTSGFLLYVPMQDVHMLDMKIEDAAKLIISAGLVYPPSKPAQAPTEPEGVAD